MKKERSWNLLVSTPLLLVGITGLFLAKPDETISHLQKSHTLYNQQFTIIVSYNCFGLTKLKTPFVVSICG